MIVYKNFYLDVMKSMQDFNVPVKLPDTMKKIGTF